MDPSEEHERAQQQAPGRGGALGSVLDMSLRNPLVIGVLTAIAVVWGLRVAPFDWQLGGFARDPVAVDAIPDTSENQQIVFTEWPGRSPQDLEDQVTYPLTVELLGVPGVETVRSTSMFGFSSIFVIFEEGADFYASRSRLLEKLASIPSGRLPEGVQPTLGPDATAVGQVFWYTLEPLDANGNPAGGFDLHELRSIQDWYVRDALASVGGVAEVASIGGHVREYQIDVDPAALRSHDVTLAQVESAVRDSNVDVGARTIEVNRAEYVVRGIGTIDSLADIESIVVRMDEGVPITIEQVANVGTGPALRRGALDRAGAEAVGGVVVARFGSNPQAVIARVKEKIENISGGLPERTLEDGSTSQVTIVPFYDRSELIAETLGTLEHALSVEVLVTVVVIVALLANLRAAAMVTGLLPLAVLLTFVAMKLTGVDANLVSLAGIAIAIGTMVDVGIVLVESVLRNLEGEGDRAGRWRAIRRGTGEVAGAVTTAVATTVVGFLPVFAMEGAAGKLFTPLAATKTFALVASIAVGLLVLPPVAVALFARPQSARFFPTARRRFGRIVRWVLLAVAMVVLALTWSPLGPGQGGGNLLATAAVVGGVLLAVRLLLAFYEPMLRWCLAHKLLFLMAPAAFVLLGATAWLGTERILEFVERATGAELTERPLAEARARRFPGLGREFMPPLDEGAFLLMPVTMPHASIGESLDLLQQMDRRIAAIPEVDGVVGKIGRVDSPLDPAPISMAETLITYRPEYKSDGAGRPLRFAYDEAAGEFVRDEQGEPIRDAGGRPMRLWRDGIRSTDDIWDAVARAADVPGMTTASKLYPIQTRRIMLSTGMRSELGLKVSGGDLESLEAASLALEKHLKAAPAVRAETVFADRLLGKPYLEIDLDRERMARYGLTVARVQRIGSQSPTEVAAAAHTILEDFATTLPPGVDYRVDSSRAEDYRQRLSLLLENGAIAVLIVLAILAAFLEVRLAFWVMMGMVISFVGGLLLLPLIGVTVNMISMFAFLVVLGIVVDDAIVVGENIHERRQSGMGMLEAAIAGARDIARPVTFSILTNIIAFVPLLFIPGTTGKFWWPLPAVVIAVLAVSLLEALFILPAHLGHVRERRPSRIGARLHRWQQAFARGFDRFVDRTFRPVLGACLKHRYITLSAAVALFVVVGGYGYSGHMGMIMMPEVAADEIEAGVNLPVGTTTDQAADVAREITDSTHRMFEKHELFRVAEGIKTNVRGQSFIDVEIVMRPPDEHDMTAAEVIDLWRAEIGDIQGVDQITFEAESGPGGWQQDISVDLSHTDIAVLERASQTFLDRVEDYSASRDVNDNYDAGKSQFDLTLLPEGRNLGLTSMDVGQQVRDAFYGALALRQLRGTNEIEVRVKLPEAEREDLTSFENYVVRTPGGMEVPLLEVADLERGSAFTSINRRNGRRVVTVGMDVEPARAVTRVLESIETEELPRLRAEYPGLTWSFQGSQAEMRESTKALWGGFGLAMAVIYALLAVAFRSYTQPLIVLVAIPFGIVGAVIGHILLGYDLSLISLMGVIALSGVVVNDALIMIDHANRHRDVHTAFGAIHEAGLRRFRPILLTTVTTFGGLTPIILETSRQASYLIPMAISLGFGIVFATSIILLLVPALYLVLEDLVPAGAVAEQYDASAQGAGEH